MEHLGELLSYPFVQRALLAGIFSGALLAVLGIFVVLRKMAFFSDGIAHTALAGVAIALLGRPAAACMGSRHRELFFQWRSIFSKRKPILRQIRSSEYFLHRALRWALC